MARETWSDERLDDLARRMDNGFDGVKGEIRDAKGEVRDLRKEMNARFDSMEARFASSQRTMIVGFASMAASIVGAVLATQL